MWIVRGIKKGVLTTEYPDRLNEKELPPCVPMNIPSSCPFGAVKDGKLDYSRCLYCGLCDAKFGREISMSEVKNSIEFRRSIHVFFMDVGTCNLCNRELSLLTGPHYDVHRLGIFFTPTPKHADVMLVAGCPGKEMLPVLREAYELMPEPKRVIVMGSCSQGALCGEKISDYIPVDGHINGCPPSPLNIIEGLLKVAGRLER